MSRSQVVFGRRVVYNWNFYYTISFSFVYPATVLGKFRRGCLLKSNISSGDLVISCRGRLSIGRPHALGIGLTCNSGRLHNHQKTTTKTEFFDGWAPWPSASATHGQTGWGLHQHRWLNNACAMQQQRPRHELAWIWTNFLCEQCQATGLVETAGGAARAGGKQQPVRCSRKTQNKFAIASMAKKYLQCCMGAHARVHVHFLRAVWYAFRQVFWAPCMCRCLC